MIRMGRRDEYQSYLSLLMVLVLWFKFKCRVIGIIDFPLAILRQHPLISTPMRILLAY